MELVFPNEQSVEAVLQVESEGKGSGSLIVAGGNLG